MSTPMTLGDMLVALRAEVGHALSPALGVHTRDTQIYILKRTQRELWESYDWPFLRTVKAIDFGVGQRHADVPPPIDGTRIKRVYWQTKTTPAGVDWYPMEYSADLDTTDEAQDMSPDDSGDPYLWRCAWDADRNAHVMGIWPIPTVVVTLKCVGIRSLNPLVADADLSTLDGSLIVQMAAVEILGRQDSKDAKLRQTRAVQYLQRLRGEQMGARRRPFILGRGEGLGRSGRMPRAGIDYIPS